MEAEAGPGNYPAAQRSRYDMRLEGCTVQYMVEELLDVEGAAREHSLWEQVMGTMVAAAQGRSVRSES